MHKRLAWERHSHWVLGHVVLCRKPAQQPPRSSENALNLPCLVDYVVYLFVRFAASCLRSRCGNDHDNWPASSLLDSVLNARTFWLNVTQANRFEQQSHTAVTRLMVTSPLGHRLRFRYHALYYDAAAPGDWTPTCYAIINTLGTMPPVICICTSLKPPVTSGPATYRSRCK
jgi:hypothetical protein